MDRLSKGRILRDSIFVISVYLNLLSQPVQSDLKPTKYDLSTDDVNNLCHKIDGFEFTESGGKAKVRNGVCYKYFWVPDPCTIEKSGRKESDMLHCGHYEMKRCDGKDETYYVPDEYDLDFLEMAGLCDNVINMNGMSPVRLPNLPCVYWKWTYCVSGKGTEERPCGRYSVEPCPAGLYMPNPTVPKGNTI